VRLLLHLASVNTGDWLRQLDATVNGWVDQHEAGLQSWIPQHQEEIKNWVPNHPLEAVVVGAALIIALRLLPGPRRGS
jgi:hypothetical protein